MSVNRRLKRTLSLTFFIACLTMTRVSKSSVSMRPSRPLRTSGFTKSIPLGETTETVSPRIRRRHQDVPMR